MKTFILFILLFVQSLLINICFGQDDQTSLPVSTLITTDSPGKMGAVASQSVLRIICSKTNMGGTGFFVTSEWIATAAHVVEDCAKQDLLLLYSNGRKSKVDSIIIDTNLDLALLKPSDGINVQILKLSSKSEIITGTIITTWGFPSGYNGYIPLLTVGYLSGVDRISTPNGLSPNRWVVNAAFNGGNSGGPVLDIDDGEVIGIVSSKLAPIPPIIESALEALSKQQSGFTYTKTLDSGKTVTVTEGQVVAEVLKYLRSQTQLVLGHAITSTDLINLMKKYGII